MRKNIINLIGSVLFSVLGLYSLCFAQAAEELTITTYYPSPRGTYAVLTVLNNTNTNEVVIDEDTATNPRVELRSKAAAGTTPYVDFSNDGAADFDARMILTADNRFQTALGAWKEEPLVNPADPSKGTVPNWDNPEIQFVDRTGKYIRIRMKEFILCAD